MPTILSVDLASRRYADNGIALMHGTAASADVELIAPDTLGLTGEPDAARFAEVLVTLAASRGASLLLLDGPQGWKGLASANAHARECERATRTPGKTGVVNVVKPASWTRMALFSIAVFDHLHDAGWPRISATWRGERAAIESFPTHAWRSLGHRALPGKAARPALAPWAAILAERHVRTPLIDASHDELQAVVAGLAGLQLLADGWRGAETLGVDPFREDGAWREGYIVSPRAT